MALKKHFLHHQIQDFQIPKQRFIIGLLIGLIYSVLIYALLYLIREVFRLLSVSEDYDLWILNESEHSFYNLFFAFIAVIFDQSISFNYWISGAKNIHYTLKLRKISIINDQNVLNWSFASWFAKLSVVFAIFYGLAFTKGYYVFSFFPDYKCLFILIIVVLFFQSWLTIRRTFKQKALKWMFVSALLVTGLSFGLSKINFSDYKAINKSYLSKSISNNYQLELPESDIYDRLYRHSLIENIYVVTTKTDINNNKPILIINHKKISFNHFMEEITNFQMTFDDFDRQFITYQLYVHGKIKIGYIIKLKQELAKCGIYNIAYATIPTQPKYDRRYYQYHSLYTYNRWHYINLWGIHSYYNNLIQSEKIIQIQQITKDSVAINGQNIQTTLLKQEIVQLMREYKKYTFMLIIDDKIDFSTYIHLISNLMAAVNFLRDEYAQKIYYETFDYLDGDEQNKVKTEYPYNIFEISEQMIKTLNIKAK